MAHDAGSCVSDQFEMWPIWDSAWSTHRSLIRRETLLSCSTCTTTQLSFWDKHAPRQQLKLRARPTVRCRMSRDVGQDKKAGEGLSTTALSSDWTEHAWRTQFSQQRTLYQHKFIDYRSCAIDACRGDSKALWSKLRPLLEPKPSSNSTLAAEDLAQYFTWKISSTRASTATSPPPRILKTFPFWSCCCWIYGRRPSTKWRSFWRSRRPNTVIFIWLVKRAGDVLALVIAHMCNVSFTQFKIPDRCKKRDILRPLLKNRALHPNDPALYRPISNLSFVSQVAEKVANGRFAADAARHSSHSVWTAVHRRICRTTASRSLVSTLGGICVPPTVNYMQYLATGSTLMAVGPSQSPAPQPGTLSRILSGTPPSVQTVSDVC